MTEPTGGWNYFHFLNLFNQPTTTNKMVLTDEQKTILDLVKETKIEREIIMVLRELMTAERKHPGWPKDLIHGAAIVSEEAGELIQASLQFTYEGGCGTQLSKESTQTAAMGLRFLKQLNTLTIEDFERITLGLR